MFSALVGDRPQFVSLLLENGVSLREFLQDERTLCDLYKQLPNCLFLHKLAKRVHSSQTSRMDKFLIRPDAQPGQTTITMSHVSAEVRHLLGGFTQPLYPCSPTTYHCNMTLEDSSASVCSSVTWSSIMDHSCNATYCTVQYTFNFTLVQISAGSGPAQ